MTAVATIGLAAATMAQTIPSYVPTNGLVGWWPFNGNANDESGNGNNGTVNGATLTSDRFGNTNKAYAFDGVDDKIISTIFNPLQSNWSVAFWFKSLNSTSNFQGQNIIGLGSDMYGWGGAGFQISGQNPPGQCPGFNYLNQMYFIDASQQCGGNYLSGGLYNNNGWYNVVIIKNNFNYDLIINNVMITSSTMLDINIDQLIFGNRDISFQYFNGNLDDIGAWNRALDSCEIKDLYFSSTGNCCSVNVTSQPNNQNVIINNDAQFITSSSNSNANYQWQTDLSVGFQNISNAGQYSGANNDTLTVSNVTLSNNNQQFRCIVSSGSCSDTSAVAVLTVNNNVGIHENTTENTFHLFPNPASNQLTITHANPQARESYTIYNMLGEAVLTGEIQSSSTVISLTTLSPGSYFIRFSNGTQQSFRLIKE